MLMGMASIARSFHLHIPGLHAAEVCTVAVRMAVAQDEAEGEVDDEADCTEQQHERAVDRGGVEEAVGGEEDEQQGEGPDEEDGDEGAEDFCAREAEAEAGVCGEAGDGDGE